MAAAEQSPELLCANWNAVNTTCSKVGKFACKNCLLVLYCGPECQKSHWSSHKLDCKSPMMRETWRPRWEIENRSPAFMGGPRLQPFNEGKYLWGNVAAYDVLQLESNEGVAYKRDLDLLFAASGDLRNVLNTIASIPQVFSQPVKVVLNDKDFDIVARNTILLLLMLVQQDPNLAAESVIHLWYSAFVPQSIVDLVQGEVRSLIQAVCTKIAGKSPGTMLGKTWTFGARSLRLVLTRDHWLSLLSYFQTPAGLTHEKAKQNRLAITLASQRVDFRERRYFAQSSSRRICAQKFKEDGILLPFGHPRETFECPNPTIFRTIDSWPLKDDSDPIDGWRISEVQKMPTGAAVNDIYGKLYFYLKNLFDKCHRRLSTLDISFQLSNTNAQDLPEQLQGTGFDRIEVANISDRAYLGPAQTVCYLGTLLKQPSVNPHATLITLFMNAVDEVIMNESELARFQGESELVYRYMPPPLLPNGRYDADIIIRDAGRALVRDSEKYFNRYIKVHRFDEFSQFMNMEMKHTHTIIDKWPERLKKRPGQKGAKEEFEALLGSSPSGCERYVEWRFKS